MFSCICKMFFLLHTAVQKLLLKNQTSFSRVMNTNVLPRFSQCIWTLVITFHCTLWIGKSEILIVSTSAMKIVFDGRSRHALWEFFFVIRILNCLILFSPVFWRTAFPRSQVFENPWISSVQHLVTTVNVCKFVDYRDKHVVSSVFNYHSLAKTASHYLFP